MAISRVTQGSAEASSATISGVSEGHVVVVFAFRRSTSTVPSIPALWNDEGSEQGTGTGNDCSVRVGWRVVTSGGLTTTGTWTNAERVFWIAMAGVNPTNPIGNITLSGSPSATLFYRYGALTLTVGQSGQWLLGAATRAQLDTSSAAPSGMSTLIELPSGAGSDSLLVSTEAIRLTDWPQTDVDAGTLDLTATYVTAVVELLLAPDPLPPDAPELTIEPSVTTASMGTPGGFVPHVDLPSDTHASTTWQITTAADTGFAAPLVDVTSTTDLLSYLAEGLPDATDLIGRARHNGDGGGLGDWSDTEAFTTLADETVGDTPTLSAVDETTTEIEVSISAYNHTDGEVEPPMDPDNPAPFLAYSEIQIRTAASSWASPVGLQTIIVPYIDGALSARFEGLTVGTSYEFRGRQFDGYLSVFTAYSNDLTHSTDSTPADAPVETTITNIVCGREVTITGDTFAHSGAGTHANTRVRICYNLSCQTIDFAGALTTVTIEDVPGGSPTFEIAYQDNSGAWGAYSDSEQCVIPMFPPNVAYTEPPHGEVIDANVLVEWEAYDPDTIGWHYDVEYSATGGTSWIELFEDRDTPSFTFTVAGRANGDYLIRVRVRNPDTDELGEWAVLPVIIDRTGSQAIHYHFADLDEIPSTWRQILDGPSHITFALRDTHDPDTDEDYRVGLEARNVHTGSTIRRSALVFDELGEPDEFDIYVAFEHIAERCQWYPYQFATPFVTRAGAMIWGTDEGSIRTGRLSLMSWETGWYLGQQMTCVSDSFRDYASAYSAKYANLSGNTGTSYRYGRSMSPGYFRTVTHRHLFATPSHTTAGMSSTTTDRTGGAYFYTDEDGVLGRGRQIFVMRQSVRRGVSGGQDGWNISSSVFGPGTSYTGSVFVRETDAFGSRLLCGACGIGFEDMDRVGVGRSEGVIFTDFAINIVSYGDCTVPETLTGCEADWDFTVFEDDDVTPWYGTADFEGNVAEADFYDTPTCPRPYLKIPKDFSETEIDYPAGASTIGAITVEVVDKRLVASDQDSGIVTAKIGNAKGHRAVLRRWREDLGMVTVFDGVIDSVEMDPARIVTWRFHLRDPREREREVALFTKNETFALWPADGPIASYGQLPNDLGYLLTPVQPEDAMEFHALALSGGVYSGYVILGADDASGLIRRMLVPNGYASLDAATGYYRYKDITVRWRPAAGGVWTYLRAMPTLGTNNAVYLPENLSGIVLGSYRLYLGALDPAELPDDLDSIDLQVLAAKTSEFTPFFWDEGTAGDLLLAIYRGDFSDEPPKIRYSADAIAAWALQTPNLRMIVREPVKNLREWVQENIYAPIGSAPSFDADMRIIPSNWELPPADEVLIELTADDIIPVGDFSDSVESIVNRVKYTIIRESVLPASDEALINFVRSLPPGVATQYALDRAADEEAAANLSEWQRLAEERITKDYVFAPSMKVVGEKLIEYKPLTVRSTGLLGEVLLGLLGVDTADRIADRVSNNILSRFGWGAAEYYASIRSGMAHGPTFDPKTLDLEVGQWVTARVGWLPEYSTGKRDLYRYMQIKSMADPDIHYRRARLIDGGPVLTTVFESGSDEDLLLAPSIGVLAQPPDAATGGARIEAPIAFPVGAPVDYKARVDYAVNATEPAADSGLWHLASYVLVSGGTASTPVLHAGAEVWIRARGEAMGRRPSAWSATETLTIVATPGLLSYFATIDDVGEPTIHWVKNPYAGGVRVERSIGAIGHSPSYSTFQDEDADEVELVLSGDVVSVGEEIYVRTTAYPGFSLGSVTGSPGSVYVDREEVPEDSSSGDLNGGTP